ncbi:MAG: hypothetical protein ISN28_08200 [Ectothiorhodospiraceae bacterium AqS1]|nr:hypothetical protein [Ectothiorhodospiraceae bacterium AqS1]
MNDLTKHLASISPATASCQFQPVEEIVDEDGFDSMAKYWPWSFKRTTDYEQGDGR